MLHSLEALNLTKFKEIHIETTFNILPTSYIKAILKKWRDEMLEDIVEQCTVLYNVNPSAYSCIICYYMVHATVAQ